MVVLVGEVRRWRDENRNMLLSWCVPWLSQQPCGCLTATLCWRSWQLQQKTRRCCWRRKKKLLPQPAEMRAMTVQARGNYSATTTAMPGGQNRGNSIGIGVPKKGNPTSQCP